MKATILLADKDAGARLALAAFLEHHGFVVLQAGHDAEVLDLFRSHKFGLVVLDTNLSRSRGWEMIARVATLNPLIPAVITTDECGQRERAAEAGVGALLEKPIEFDVLLRIVRELLAQPTVMRLHRVCSVAAFSRYVPRSYETVFRKLQQRYSAPLAMPELERALARCVPPLKAVFPASGASAGTAPGPCPPTGPSDAAPA